MKPPECQSPPKSEAQLLQNCLAIEGLTFLQLANAIGMHLPTNPLQRKGWTGMAIERALGADAKSQSVPDFTHLGIELKTLPLKADLTPAETTFVTSIPLLTIHQQRWESSQCKSKLKQVLWLPVEGDNQIPFQHRRIGRAVLWSPNRDQEQILSADWLEITTMISTGRLEEIDASIGTYLHVRPKAANARSLCFGFDAQGNKIKTMPRGFYLRTALTKDILLTMPS